MATSTVVSARQVRAFHHAADLLKEVSDALLKNEGPANVILPYAKKASNAPRGDNGKPLWIVVYDNAGSVEYVLSCTRGPIDEYPIFVVDCKSSPRLTQGERGESVTDAMQLLVRCLLEQVPPTRVFSVFSTAGVATKFAEAFVAQVPKEFGIQALKEPYYDATFTFCTRSTLRKPAEAVTPFPGLEDIVIALRPAGMADLKATAVLFKGFSKTSEPYVLGDADAELEAKTAIEAQKVWVHTIQRDAQDPEIACLVATTRESENVTAVTKVFTAEKWRGRGCAGRLLYRVCDEILQKKNLVVLYVGNTEELAPARKVYHKVGFQGLAPQGQQVNGVERWLEYGFTNTTLGYW